jgi:membrane-bound ClpP family serine protease
MGWGSFELGGLMKVLGVLVIIVGIGLAFYEYTMGNMVTALVAFVALLILGLVMVSWGGYSRKQNTPIGRVDDVQG